MTDDKPRASVSIADSISTERPSMAISFPGQTRREVLNQQHQDIRNYADIHCTTRRLDDPFTLAEIDLLEKLHERIGAAISAISDGRE